MCVCVTDLYTTPKKERCVCVEKKQAQVGRPRERDGVSFRVVFVEGGGRSTKTGGGEEVVAAAAVVVRA